VTANDTGVRATATKKSGKTVSSSEGQKGNGCQTKTLTIVVREREVEGRLTSGTGNHRAGEGEKKIHNPRKVESLQQSSSGLFGMSEQGGGVITDPQTSFEGRGIALRKLKRAQQESRARKMCRGGGTV